MNKKQLPPCTVVNGIVTLPLYSMRARLLEDLPPFARGQAKIELHDPEYTSPTYDTSPSELNRIGSSPDAAIQAIKTWMTHSNSFMYFAQFKDDDRGQRQIQLSRHTELLSILCDSRLKFDPTTLWTRFDNLITFADVHSRYRADEKRDQNRDLHVDRLREVHDRMCENPHGIARFVDRMVKAVEIVAATWSSLPPIFVEQSAPQCPKSVNVFYCYSHKDEGVLDKLRSHLSLLRREGLISEWHDRSILAGEDWNDQIDEHINNSELVLLLISPDFMNSDYCYKIELRRAMERHTSGQSRVVPIILKPCDWKTAPFASLQAVPKDGKPIVTWSNRDEAFLDVAQHIRIVIKDILNRNK